MDKDPTAAARFFRAIQKHNATGNGVLTHDVKPDEIHDITLISERVYGHREEYLAVLASYGASFVVLPIEQKTITLPTPEALIRIKRETGFESMNQLRQDGEPVWLT